MTDLPDDPFDSGSAGEQREAVGVAAWPLVATQNGHPPPAPGASAMYRAAWPSPPSVVELPPWMRRRERNFVDNARRLSWTSLVVLLVVTAVAGVVSWYTAPGEGFVVLVPVRVPLSLDPGDSAVSRPIVSVQIGNNPPIPVILDTGSVGLRVFAGALPTGPTSGVETTTTADSIEYADGSVLSGTVAWAHVGIGRLRTSLIPIEVVNRESCASGMSPCPAPESDPAIAGIMGTGLIYPLSSDPPTNPLEGLNGGYAQRWSISLSGALGSGTLTLGASAPPTVTTRFPLQAAYYAADQIGWVDEPTVCWSIGQMRTCQPTVFDTGSDAVDLPQSVLNASSAPSVQAVDKNLSIVNGGTEVRASLPGVPRPFWAFRSSLGGLRTVFVVRSLQGSFTSGAAFFFGRTVYYDTQSGQIDVGPGTT